MGLDNPERPLRSRLLQVPQWRDRYLAYVGQIAENDLDWNRLGPEIAAIRSAMQPLVEVDSRKHSRFEDFVSTTSDVQASPGPRGPSMSLRAFADGRREYLLQHPEVQRAMENHRSKSGDANK
jgi:hypothetical protein